jgi:hypothetical protein
VSETVFDPKNRNRIKNASRAEADDAAWVVSSGNERLPDEDTIRWIFQWKGQPPDSDVPDLIDMLRPDPDEE